MKAGINGVLSMSIADGWFDEAAEQSGGWMIGNREAYSQEQEDMHAAGIYSLLENEIAPMFYGNREQGVPVEWMRRVKQSLRFISANFNCQRMVNEYRSQLYEPAHRAWQGMLKDGFSAARDRAQWQQTVTHKWPLVGFVDSGIGPDAVSTGAAVPLRAEVELAGLSPQDVRVEAVVGRVGPSGDLEETQVLTLAPLEQRGTAFVFGRDFAPMTTGRLGYSVRVSPNHSDDPLNRPCNLLMKWAGEGAASTN